MKKFLRDLWSTLYDLDGYMSLPRFMCFVLFISLLIAWLLEQCISQPFEHFGELTAAYGVAMGGYVGKKISERGTHDAKDK